MARIVNAFEQFFDAAGDPLVNGKLYFYESGSSSVLKNTFADAGQTILNTNPVVLTADGRAPNVFGEGSYRCVLTDKDDVQILFRDPVGGAGDQAFGADWNSVLYYDISDVVRDEQQYWISLTAQNINNKPSTDGGTNWVAWPDDVTEEAPEDGTSYARQDKAWTNTPKFPAIFGRTTSAGVGEIGELIESTGGVSVTTMNSSTYYPVQATVTLTPGLWVVSYNSLLEYSSGNPCLSMIFRIKRNGATSGMPRSYFRYQTESVLLMDNGVSDILFVPDGDTAIMTADQYQTASAGASRTVTQSNFYMSAIRVG